MALNLPNPIPEVILQETLKKVITEIIESQGKSVTLCIQSQLIVLDGLWKWDMQSEAVYCSDVMSFPENFEGTKGIIHPDDVTRVSSALELLADQETFRLEFHLITTYGEVKTISGNKIAIRKEEDKPPEEPQNTSWEEATEPLVIRKEAEQLQLQKELAEASEKLHNIGTWYINKSTGEVYYSHNLYSIYGLPAYSLNAHAHTFYPFIHPEDRVVVTDALENAYKEELPLHLEYRIVRPDGAIRYVHLATHWSYNQKGHLIISGVLQDVTEQAEVSHRLAVLEYQLRLQEQTLHFVEQQTTTGYWYANLITRKISFSANCLRILGWKQMVFPSNETFLNLIYPEDRERVAESLEKMYYEHTLPEMEFRIIRNDGKLRYLKQWGKVLISNEAEMVILGTVRDITVKKGLDQKIEDLSQKLELQEITYKIAESSTNISTIVWNLTDESMTWSEGFYSMLGYKPGSVEPSLKLLLKQVYAEDLKSFKDTVTLVLNGQHPNEQMVRLISKGGIRQVKITFHSVTDTNKPTVVGVVQDVAQQLSLQQQLTGAEQLNELLNDSVNECIILTNTNHTILNWNHQAEVRTGIKKSEALSQNLFDVFPALKSEEFLNHLQVVLSDQKVSAFEVKNGYLKTPHHYYLTPYKNEKGDVTGVLHNVLDASKEVELQQRLNERLNFIENLVESSVDRIVVLDRHMNYLYWNRKAEEFYAINKQRVLGKNILEIFPAFRNDPSYMEFRRVLKGETVNLPAVISEDSADYFETYLTPIKDNTGAVTAILWVAHDRSKDWWLQQQQQRTLALLQQEHQHLKEAEAIGHIGSFEWDAETDDIHWSDEMYRIHGLEPQCEQITFEKVLSFIHPDDRQDTAEKMKKCREEPTTVTLTHRIKRADGATRTVAKQIQSFSETGRVTHLSGMLQDITEQAQAKETIQQMFNGSISAICIFQALRNDEGKIIDFIFKGGNRAAEVLNDMTMEDMLGKGLLEVFPGVKEEFFDSYVTVVETGKPMRVQKHYSHEHFDNWFDVSAVKSEDGFIMTFHDITVQKKAELELEQNKAFIEEITQTIPDLITIYDVVSNRLIYANHNDFWKGVYNLQDVYGLDEEHRAATMIHADDLKKSMAYLQERKQLQGNEVKEVELKMKSGRWIRVRSKVFKRDEKGTATQIISFTTDITNSRKAEGELQKQFTILQQTESIAQIGSWEYDTASDRFEWSEGMYLLFGLPQNFQVNPETYLDFAIKEDRPIAKRIIKNIKQKYQPFEETIRIQKGSKTRLLKVKGSVVYNENGEAQKIIGVDLDITDVTEAEEKFQKSQQWLQQTTAASPDAMIIYDLAKKQPIYLNNCLAEWLGTTLENLVEVGVTGRLTFIHDEDRLPVLRFNEKVAEAPDGKVLTLEYRITTLSGEIRWVHNRSKVFERDDKGKATYLLSVLQDITEEKKSGEELKILNSRLERKNQELESKNEEITSFAFVASHDLREPLRKINTFSNWIVEKEKENLSQQGKDYLQRLQSAVTRMGNLIDDILILSRVNTQHKEFKAVNLNEVLSKALSELQADIVASHAVIESEDLPSVEGNSSQLLYLFKNLISNAIKFQPKEATPHLTIKSKKVKGENIEGITDKQEDSFLQISFTDNGIGFDPKYSRKLFQVFQRLHSGSEYSGTGMGLTICKNVMENHGGYITAESEEGKGATFNCYFPVKP